MPGLKDLLTFVLVRTQFAANLGSAARVMKNMGFSRLLLVDPRCEIGVEARSRAMKGAEVLDRAELCATLGQAAARVNLLVGTSGVMPAGKPSLISCRSMADQLVSACSGSTIGIAFGSEENGLRRDEIELCHWLVEIPTASEYSSINLAQSVAIVAYDLHMAVSSAPVREWLHRAGPEELEALLGHAREVFSAEPFGRLNPLRVLHRLRRILGRARLEVEDAGLLHQLLNIIGFLAQKQSSAGREAGPRRQ